MGIAKKLRHLFKRFKFYQCLSCGYVLPKEEVVTSGWDSQQSLRHIHCPKCGKTITHIT